MKTPAIGQPIAPFTLPATGGRTITLSELQGKKVVLYFYPKDHTPGCTTEGQDFRDHHAAFTALNAVVLGISRDSIQTHENFKRRHALPFDLLADQNEALSNQFDVIKAKTLYGKPVRGIERSTFLIDEAGVLRYEWRKVKVPGHVIEVLAALKALDTPPA